MGKCVKCNKFYHPDYCVDALPDDPNDTAKICLFCKLDKNELTIEDSNGNALQTIKKDEASRLYEIYIKKLKENRKVDSLIKTGKQSKIIMPGEF